jgi:hypothetical protein
MAAPPDPGVLSDLSRCFELILNPLFDTDNFACAWIGKYRSERGLISWISLLVFYYSETSNSDRTRAVAAILLYGALRHRTPDVQRQTYQKLNIEIREKICKAGLASINSAVKPDYLVQTCNLLGTFFALELTVPGGKVAAFVEAFNRVIEMGNSGEELIKCSVYQIIQAFAVGSLELKEKCTQDQLYIGLCPRLLKVLLGGLARFDLPRAQRSSLSSLGQSLLLFPRAFSFPQVGEQLINLTIRIIKTGPPEFLSLGYQVLRKTIDFFYPALEVYMPAILELTVADLNSGVDNRQIEGCFLWSTVGDVERDILSSDRRAAKQNHHDFDHCFHLAVSQFSTLFPILCGLIATTDPTQTEAYSTLDYTPSHAALACISNLAAATDAPALPLIFDYVKANRDASDWRLRHTACLLMHAASQLPSFNSEIKDVLFAYDFLSAAIVDPIPRISEVAMWSVGVLIQATPDVLVGRFDALLAGVIERLGLSEVLAARGCWLLNLCFSALDPDDPASPLPAQFGALSDTLLEAADAFGMDVQDAALGALARLVERTPPSADYSGLFQKLSTRLAALLQVPPGQQKAPMLADLLSLLQAVVINGNDLTCAHALVETLIPALDGDTGIIADVLPAIGAAARALTTEFDRYLEGIVPRVFGWMESEDLIRPAALFVSDVVCAIPALDAELLSRFVDALIARVQCEALEGKLAVFGALGDIARCPNGGCPRWADAYLGALEAEAKTALAADANPADAKAFATVCLQGYQAVVPVLASVKGGDRKVRGFFHVVEHIFKLDCVDDAVVSECVVLIKAIAETFQRKMSVFLNKPAVIELLRVAVESDNEELGEVAKSTFQYVKSF